MCIPLLLSVHPCFCHLPSGCGAAQWEGRGPGTAGKGKFTPSLEAGTTALSQVPFW